MMIGVGMPKANQYIIQNEIDKKYYKIDRSGNYFGTLNEAWSFPKEDLREQTRMLRRYGELYEIILQVNENGSLLKIR